MGTIAGRVQEIVGAGARRAEVTVTSLLDELDRVLSGALDNKQFAAARSAIDSKARLRGLFIDRVEIGGPNEFATCSTQEEVIALLIEQLGGGNPAAAIAWLDELKAMIEARAASAARPIVQVAKERAVVAPKAKPGGRSEAERSVALVRK